MSTRKSLLTILGIFILLYAGIFAVNLVLGVGPNLLMKSLEISPNVRTYVGTTLTYGLRLAAYIVLPALALRRVLGKNPGPIFFPAPAKSWKDMLGGLGLVSIALGGLFLYEVQSGGLVVEGWNWQALPVDAWLRTAWTALLVNLAVAVGEETIFRGYLLTSLNTVVGRWPALVIMMVVFGLFHLIAYAESGLDSIILVLAIVLASLFGGLFGLIYLRTRSLWAPVVMHFAWNFVEADVLNLTGSLDNPNLIGALTRLQSPLSLNAFDWGNIIILEGLVFAVIAAGVWLRLRFMRVAEPLG